MLRNSGAVSLLQGRLGLQVVVETTPLMIAWWGIGGMRPKGHKMGKGLSLYKGR